MYERLLLEIGNSTLKLARVAPDGEIDVTRYGSVESLTAELGEGRPQVLCAPVGRELSAMALPILQRVTRLHVISREDFAGFIAGSYDTPETLGLDRILNLVGLAGDGIVISCGTAITVDAVVAGVPHWGAIMPGFRTAAEGLHARVPALPLVSPDSSTALPARTSHASVANGVLLGTASGAQGLARRLAGIARDTRMPRVVLTGGDAMLLAELWEGERPEVDETLLFRGMMKVKSH
jgi:pantothenate kinase type III